LLRCLQVTDRGIFDICIVCGIGWGEREEEEEEEEGDDDDDDEKEEEEERKKEKDEEEEKKWCVTNKVQNKHSVSVYDQ
jgi:hypothetical protein